MFKMFPNLVCSAPLCNGLMGGVGVPCLFSKEESRLRRLNGALTPRPRSTVFVVLFRWFGLLVACINKISFLGTGWSSRRLLDDASFGHSEFGCRSQPSNRFVDVNEDIRFINDFPVEEKLICEWRFANCMRHTLR